MATSGSTALRGRLPRKIDRPLDPALAWLGGSWASGVRGLR